MRLVQRRLGGAAGTATHASSPSHHPRLTIASIRSSPSSVFAQLRGAHELRPSQRMWWRDQMRRLAFSSTGGGAIRSSRTPTLLRRPPPSLDQSLRIPKPASHLVQYVDRRTEESRELLEQRAHQSDQTPPVGHEILRRRPVLRRCVAIAAKLTVDVTRLGISVRRRIATRPPTAPPTPPSSPTCSRTAHREQICPTERGAAPPLAGAAAAAPPSAALRRRGSSLYATPCVA